MKKIILFLLLIMSPNCFAQLNPNYLNLSGNVGIGTTSPNQSSIPLYVSGSSNIVGTFVNRSSSGTSTTNGATLRLGSDDGAALDANHYAGCIAFVGSTNTSHALGNIALICGVAADTISGADAPGIIDFRTIPDGSSTSASRMRIVDNGNVGIGTASPQSLFQVLGDSRVGNGTFSNTSANEDLYIEGNLEVDGTIYPNVINGYVIGTNVQAFDSDLSTYAGITPTSAVQDLLDDSFADDQVWISSSSSAGAPTSIGDCDDSSGNHLNYDTATNSFSCGTSSSGGGGGGWTDGGTNVYASTTTDSVGIGTTTPTGKLDVRLDEVRVWTGAGTNTNSTSAGELYVEGDLEVDGTIYSSSIEGGGAGAASITNANVGIGTTSPPTVLLHVGNGAGSPTSVGSNDVYIQNDLEVDGTVYMGSCSGAGCGTGSGWTTDSSSKTTTTYNVGIGTTSPTRLLEVATSTSSVYPSFGIKNSANEAIRFEVNSADDVSEASFGSAQNLKLKFFTNDVDAPPALTLDYGGSNVGIGTVNPRSLLEIDKGTGTAQVTIDGTTGACLMLQDTDGAGWTECDALNGVLTCSTDADGICD